MKSFAVIGLGRFGAELACQLAKRGCEVLAIDKDRKLVDTIADDVTRAVTANSRDREALEELGVTDCDCAINAIGGDLAASVLTTMNLKSLKIPVVICKAYDEIHREVLLKLGADRVIIPEQEMADRLASALIDPKKSDYMPLSKDYGIQEVPVPESWAGKTVGALHVRNDFGVNIVAVRSGGNVNVAITPDLMFQEGDILALVGTVDSLGLVRSLK